MSFASPKSIIFTCKLDSALKISVQVCLLMIRLTGWRKQCCLVWCRGGWCRCRAWTQSQRQPVLDCWLWEFPKTKCFYLLLTSYCYDFLPVEQTFCTYLQSAGTLCYWSSQTALLPKDTKSVWTFFFYIFCCCHFSLVLTSRYSVKMTLCKPDSKYSSKSRMALHSFICTLDDVNWSFLRITLVRISSSFLA